MKKAEMKALYKRADAAGKAAAEKRVPIPMVVVQRANPLDDNSPIVKRYAPVMGGVCGFAWVNIKPGYSAFANWLKKNKLADKSYYGGVDVWVGGYGQSMEKKEAYANAFAAVLRAEAGINAMSMSRLD